MRFLVKVCVYFGGIEKKWFNDNSDGFSVFVFCYVIFVIINFFFVLVDYKLSKFFDCCLWILVLLVYLIKFVCRFIKCMVIL